MNKGRQLADYFRSKAEEITELKKSTLQSYTAKAVGSKSSLDFMRGVKMAQGSGGEEELRTKSNKRSEGIHRAIKKIAEEITPVQSAAAQQKLKQIEKSGMKKSQALYDKLVRIANANKKLKEGHVPDDHGRYIADADKRTLGKLADLMQKERPKKKPETPEEIKQSVKESEQLDELKKSTLGSYIKKATTQAVTAGLTGMAQNAGHTPKANQSEPGSKAFSVMRKREAGVKLAADKLTKEEVEQIAEISTAAKQNYINAAALDVARHGNMLGRAQLGKSKTSQKASGDKITKRLQGIATATSKLTEDEQLDEVSDELAMKVGMARTANVNKAGAEYRHTSIMGSDSERKTALDKLKAAEAKRDKGSKVHVARSNRHLKSFLDQHAKKMAARSPEQVKKDNEAENAERHKNYKERGWTLD